MTTSFEPPRMDIAGLAAGLYRGLVKLGGEVRLDPGLRGSTSAHPS